MLKLNIISRYYGTSCFYVWDTYAYFYYILENWDTLIKTDL